MNQIHWENWTDPLSKMKPLGMEENETFDSPKIGPVIMGPLGIMQIENQCLVSADTDFYVGHTNFDLTEPVIKRIEKAIGVESLTIMTRYRFRVSFGKRFCPETVKTRIEDLFRPLRRANRIENLKNFMQSKYDNWAICMLKNGMIRTKAGTKTEVLDAIQGYKRVANLEIQTSWD